MSITIASTALPARRDVAQAVTAYREALSDLRGFDLTSRNTFVRRAVEARLSICREVEAQYGVSSALVQDCQREDELIGTIKDSRDAGRPCTERMRSLGKVQGRIHRRLTAHGN